MQQPIICYNSQHFYKTYRSLIDLESYGHDIEASWLLDRACEALDDSAYEAEILPIVTELAKGAYQQEIDRENHAMNNECENGNVSITTEECILK